MKITPTIRVEDIEIPNISDSLFETICSNFKVIITQNGKDTAIMVPYEEYKQMSEFVEKGTKDD